MRIYKQGLKSARKVLLVGKLSRYIQKMKEYDHIWSNSLWFPVLDTSWIRVLTLLL